MTEPQTEAGRRLFSRFWSAGDYDRMSQIVATLQLDILAIEAEARALAEAAPPSRALDVEFVIESFRYSKPLGQGESLRLWERNEETIDAIRSAVKHALSSTPEPAETPPDPSP